MNENTTSGAGGSGSSSQTDSAALETERSAVSARAEAFACAIASEVTTMLAAKSIALGSPVDHRIKSWQSIRDNIDQKGLKLASVFDLHDFIGLRVMLLFHRDVKAACASIEEQLEVQAKDDAVDRLGQDRFGYASVHYIVTMPEQWLSVPTLKHFGGLRAEIQVRTLAQHIWAASSHILQYKHEESVPPDVRRAIHRASALLETVDLEFERVLVAREKYRESLRRDSDVSPREPLNVDLLEKVLDSRFPAANKTAEEPYGNLFRELNYFGVRTLGELSAFLDTHLTASLAKEQERVAKERRRIASAKNPSPQVDVERISRGVFYNHAGLLRNALASAHGQANVFTAMKRLREKSKSPALP